MQGGRGALRTRETDSKKGGKHWLRLHATHHYRRSRDAISKYEMLDYLLELDIWQVN